MSETRSACCRHERQLRRRQQGVALLLVLLIAITLGLAFFFRPGNDDANRFTRERTSEDALTQARDALIGFAATYRDMRPPQDQVFGYLPCPDLDNDGAWGVTPDPINYPNLRNCPGAGGQSLIGRVPWKELGIAALRDSANECLWYTVSGRAKDSPKTIPFNWDTLGQFIVKDADGNTLAGATPHDRPFAVLLAPRNALNGQPRSSAGASECGGSNTASDYLEGLGALSAGDTTLVVASANSTNSGTNNDRGLWITNKDIFDRVKARSDFKTDVDTLLNDLVACLNSRTIVTASLANKGITNIDDPLVVPRDCFAPTEKKKNIYKNWKDNLLYAGGPSGSFTINGGTTSCKAILIFGGERTTGQSRATALEKDTASNYLEGTNATLFPSNGAYTGATNYVASASSNDIVRCVTGLPAGATQVSFAQDLASFTKTGATGTITANTTENTVTIVDNSAGTAAGCYWSPIPIPLAGKTLRAYYEYQFAFADTFATSGAAADRGNGFTLQLVRGDIANTLGVYTQPNTCGTETNLGALATSDVWGSLSYIVETDVRRNTTQRDPTGNHTAIMINGSLNHSGSGGTPTSACDGSSNGCLHTPANTFEDTPTPQVHSQRVEIHTGFNAACVKCNATCAQCDKATCSQCNTTCPPISPAVPGASYAKIYAWKECTDCNDVVSDLLNAELIISQANRDFSAPGDWVGTDWVVAANALNHSAGANAASLPNLALSTPPTPGNAYQIDLVINTTVAGDISIAFGGVATPTLSQTLGTTSYSLRFLPSSSTQLTITPDANWIGGIRQISIKRPPTINRCVTLYPEMSQVFFGLTGGFLSGADTAQGVTLKNLLLRTD